MKRLFLVLLALLLSCWSFAAPPPQAQPIGEYLRGTVGAVLEGGEVVVTLDSGEVVNAVAGRTRSDVGERVIVWRSGPNYAVDGPVRYGWLGTLLGAFAVLAAVIGRGRGVRAVLGAALSLLVLGFFVVPRLAAGGDVLVVTSLGTLFILVATIYLVHGVNRKTSAALLGTLLVTVFGLGLTALLARLMAFTGATDDGALLASSFLGLDPLALYLASVVLGAVGALNDVTVTQASVVHELAASRPGTSWRELYGRAMRVGLDHIGGAVNVLVLVYAASALPLMLFFARDPAPWWQKINGEGLATQITSVLVGAICVLLAVPLTTLLAAWLVRPGRS